MSGRGVAVVVVSLALLAVCGLITVVIASTVSLVRVDGRSLRWWDGDGYAVTERETKAYPVGAAARLTVDTVAGGVTVTLGADDVIEVETVRTGLGISAAAARANLGRLQPSAEQAGDHLTLTFRPAEDGLARLPFGDHRGLGTVGYNIRVPRELAAELETANGDIRLAGTRGTASLTSMFGDLVAEDVGGGQALALSTRQGDVTARDVDVAQLKLDTSFGDTTVSGSQAAGIAAESGNGDITVTDSVLEGPAGCCALVAHTGFGDIAVRQTRAARYDLESSNGDVEADGSSGALRLHTNFGDIRAVRATDATLDLETSNGDVTFEGRLADAPAANAKGGPAHSARSNFGDVTAAIDPAARLDLLLETDFGDVSSDLPLTVSGTVSGDRLTGKLNGGGPRLELSTHNGAVRLERAAARGTTTR
jgi:hypothetical protein